MNKKLGSKKMNQNNQKTTLEQFNCKTPNWLEVQRSQCSFPIGDFACFKICGKNFRGLCANLKRRKKNEDVGIHLVVPSERKKPKLPKKRLRKILKKTGHR